jgi:hypothetical protein
VRDPLPPTMAEILTTQEAADAMRLSKKAFERLPIKYSKVGRFRRYLRKDLLSFLEERAS